MKKYIRAPFVLPGLLLVAGGIIASIFIRNIENNMVYMLASMGCALLCLIEIRRRSIISTTRGKNDSMQNNTEKDPPAFSYPADLSLSSLMVFQ